MSLYAAIEFTPSFMQYMKTYIISNSLMGSGRCMKDLANFLLNCPKVYTKRPHCWLDNIGSGNGLVTLALRYILSHGIIRPWWDLSIFIAVSKGTHITMGLEILTMIIHVRWLFFNSILPGQNGRHFADDIFRCIVVNEKFCLLIKISLKYVPKSPIDSISVLV